MVEPKRSGGVGTGEGPRIGAIGICAQCRNKAEVSLYPNDNPEPICESCYRDNQKLEKVISDKREASGIRDVRPIAERQPQNVTGDPERDRYIEVITEGAKDEWVTSFIREVVTKNVLKYDWKYIIRNERWFSVLDLRRFALEVNPGFEDVSVPSVPSENIKEPKLVKRTSTSVRTQRKKEPAHVVTR